MTLSWLPLWKTGAQDSDDPRFQTSLPEGKTGRESQTSASLAMPISAEVILEALREVEDPELGISIVELGLIYGIQVEDQRVRVQMTLTSPGCPIGPMLMSAIHGAVQRTYPHAEDVKVDLVWNPPWDPYQMASEEAKDMLGIW